MKLRSLVLVFAVLFAGCTESEPPVPVVVGAKTSTEQRVLAEIIAQTIEGSGMPVERRLDMGGTAELDDALRTGKIDVYVEYTGIALISVLRSPGAAAAVTAGPEAVLTRVRAEYEPLGLIWTAPLGFDNPLALVVHATTAAVTISEAVAPAHNWRAAFTMDFQQGAYYYGALKRAYGLQFAEIRTIDAAAQYRPLIDHQVDAVIGTLTDAAITRLSLRALQDDKRAFAPCLAAPLARRAALQQHPGLEDALNSLADTLDVATMRKMNEAVEIGGRTPAEVAAEFIDNL
jgi:osmoprotectant transport system substrate-binding protein